MDEGRLWVLRIAGFRMLMRQMNKRGMTLVEVMVSVTILSIGVGALSVAIRNQSLFGRYLSTVDELSALRARIFRDVDCTNTLAAYQDASGNIASCPAPLTLKDGANAALYVGNAGGGWVLTASCDITNNTLTVKAQKNQGSSGGVVSDSILGPLATTNAKFNPLVGNGTPYLLCTQMFGTPPRVGTFAVPIDTTADFAANGITSVNCPKAMSLTSAQAATEMSAYPNYTSRANAACFSYCRGLATGHYLAGYLDSCAGGANARCTCIR